MSYAIHPIFEWEYDFDTEILMCYCSDSTYPGIAHTHGQLEHEQERKLFYSQLARKENENVENIYGNIRTGERTISGSGILEKGCEDRRNSVEDVSDDVWRELRTAFENTSKGERKIRTANKPRPNGRAKDGVKRLRSKKAAG